MGDHELQLFQSIGLSEGKAKETAKNVALSKNLAWIICEVNFHHVIPIPDNYHVRQTRCVMETLINKLETCCIILQQDTRVPRRTVNY